MRINGLGWFRPRMIRTKLVSYKVMLKLYGPQVTVIVSATVNARKTEARRSFNVGSMNLPSRDRPFHRAATSSTTT
jgi:hypothetical protein